VSDHPVRLFVFVLANLAITLGYLTLGIGLIPRIPTASVRTRIGGAALFLFGAGLHFDLSMLALFGHSRQTFQQIASTWPVMLLCLAQAISVGVFVSGRYIEGLGDEPAIWDHDPEVSESSD
jgi:hypothetical protein